MIVYKGKSLKIPLKKKLKLVLSTLVTSGFQTFHLQQN